MVKTCLDCNIEFKTNSLKATYCSDCRENRLQRVCEICGTVFKARKPNEVRPTCGKQECINASISRKFTPERKKAQGAKLAQRNRDTYNAMSESEKAQITERIMNWNRNATPAEKEARRQREMETKANWTDEQKAEQSRKSRENNIKRYASMTEQDYKELLGKRFKHLTNIENFDREFILLNFADENGVIKFEQRMKIKEYYNLQIGLGGIAQLLKRKFNIESKMFSQVSQGELEIRKILQEWLPSERVIYNDRNTIPGAFGKFLEIDVYYPDLKIGIEYNGTYWHEDKEYSKGMNSEDYKTIEAEKKGIKIFHIWEDDVESGLEEFYMYLKSLSKL